MSGHDANYSGYPNRNIFILISRLFLVAAILLSLTIALGHEGEYAGIVGDAAPGIANKGTGAGTEERTGAGAEKGTGAGTEKGTGAGAEGDAGTGIAGSLAYMDAGAAEMGYGAIIADAVAAGHGSAPDTRGDLDTPDTRGDLDTPDTYDNLGKPYIQPDMETAEKILDALSPLASFLSGVPDVLNLSGVPDAPKPVVKFGTRAAAGTQYAVMRRADTAHGAAFPALGGFLTSVCDHSAELAYTHQTLLDMRLDSIANARQLASAKYLSQSAYAVEMAWRTAFIEAHGMSGDQLGENDIAKLYDNDYFNERLKELGFYRNDKYGNDVNRRNAIIRAQSFFNIPITAKIDLTTKRALIKGTNYVPRDIIKDEHPEGMWVTIDKSARILTVYIDDQVFSKYPVAVGRSISLTPEGKFTFVSKAVNPRWGGGGYAEPIAGGAPNNPLGKRWMGLSKGGGGSYGVHGNVSPYSIGTNASHGCVRMINSDVIELYEYIQIGTPVWIGTTDKLNEWGVYQLLGCWEPDPPNYMDYMPKQEFSDE